MVSPSGGEWGLWVGRESDEYAFFGLLGWFLAVGRLPGGMTRRTLGLGLRVASLCFASFVCDSDLSGVGAGLSGI